MIKVEIYQCIKQPEINTKEWNFKINKNYIVKQSKNNLNYMIKNEEKLWIVFYNIEKLNTMSYLFSCFNLIDTKYFKNYEELKCYEEGEFK